MQNKISLIFPPYVWGCIGSYYPSIAILAAHLFHHGYQSYQYDLNNSFFEYYYTRKFFGKLIDKNVSAIPRCVSEQEKYELLINRLKYQEIYDALETKNIFQILNQSDDIIMPKPSLSSIFSGLESNIASLDEFDKEFEEDVVFKPFFEAFISTIPNSEFWGISLSMASQIYPTLAIAKLIKNKYPSSHIIVGGAITSLLDNECLHKIVSNHNIDNIVVGEGEHALLDIIKTKKNCDQIIANGYCSFDESEIPLYDLEAVKNFGIKKLSLIQSRGCYWGKCSFCDYINIYHNVQYKQKKVDKLIEEMVNIIDIYNISSFNIVNEAMTAKYAMDFASKIVEQGLKIQWSSFMKIDPCTISQFSIKNLEESGCNYITFGVESLDDDVLLLLRKGYDSNDALLFLEQFKDSSITIYINIIIDAPGTTYEKAISIFSKIKCINAPNFIYHTYDFILTPTSKMGKKPEAFGLLIDNRGDSRKTRRGPFRRNLAFTYDNMMSDSQISNIKRMYLTLNKENETMKSNFHNKVPLNLENIQSYVINNSRFKYIGENIAYQYLGTRAKYLYDLYLNQLLKLTEATGNILGCIHDTNGGDLEIDSQTWEIYKLLYSNNIITSRL